MLQAVYRIATGELVSTTSDPAQVALGAGMAVVEVEPPQPGWRWNPATLRFEAPPPPREISGYAFLSRFTAEERIGIRESGDPVIRDFLHLLDLAAASGVPVDLDGAVTVAGMDYLVAASRVTEQRRAEILA